MGGEVCLTLRSRAAAVGALRRDLLDPPPSVVNGCLGIVNPQNLYQSVGTDRYATLNCRSGQVKNPRLVNRENRIPSIHNPSSSHHLNLQRFNPNPRRLSYLESWPPEWEGRSVRRHFEGDPGVNIGGKKRPTPSTSSS